MAGIDKFCERMRFWCESGNLGYDQSNRWDIRYGGECDCSSLVYWCLWESGLLQKPSDSPWNHTLYTGTIKRDLERAGWTAVKPDGRPRKGDILLNEGYHVAAMVSGTELAQASIDERGRATGGQSGDQGNETNVKPYYVYSRGWDWYMRFSGSSAVIGNFVQRLQTELNTQCGAGLQIDGEWGRLTKAAASQSCAILRKGDAGNMTRILQEALNAKGYALDPDGEFGQKTLDAVTSFQQKSGLEVDGEVGGDTWQALIG